MLVYTNKKTVMGKITQTDNHIPTGVSNWSPQKFNIMVSVPFALSVKFWASLIFLDTILLIYLYKQTQFSDWYRFKRSK